MKDILLWTSIFFILGMIIGGIIVKIFFMFSESQLKGIYLRNTTYPFNLYGDWVCVNVRGMSYERALRVCEHEVGHEIYAESCEKNFTKCKGKLLENES